MAGVEGLFELVTAELETLRVTLGAGVLGEEGILAAVWRMVIAVLLCVSVTSEFFQLVSDVVSASECVLCCSIVCQGDRLLEGVLSM